MRFCYADPPYLGCALRLYGDATYDSLAAHARLIDRLSDEWPDGWAYSLHEPSLKRILPLCPDDVRVMPWVKPFASFKPGVNPAYAWEPVIFRGGRRRTREQPTVRDWVSCNITLKRNFAGAKPQGFVWWMLDVLNLEPGDEFVDLFPGSGAVTSAYGEWLAMKRHDATNDLEMFIEPAA